MYAIVVDFYFHIQYWPSWMVGNLQLAPCQHPCSCKLDISIKKSICWLMVNKVSLNSIKLFEGICSDK